ncbi:MAG: hypothetical protein IKQ18_05725 [Clostridia bacterium]|nr:hypothetical protein [Clostridia bacterium]
MNDKKFEKLLNKEADKYVRENKDAVMKSCGVETKKQKPAILSALPAVAAVVFIAAFAVICYIPVALKNNGTSSGTETAETTDTDGIYTQDFGTETSVLFYNNFRSVNKAPFSLPDKTPEIYEEHGIYIYKEIKEEYYKDYVASLKNKGFDAYEKDNYGYLDAFLTRDDCMIFISFSKEENKIEMSWYAQTENKKGALTEEEASRLLCPGNSYSKIPLRPVDITPDSFYELTGGQIFAVPVFSTDEYVKQGYEPDRYEARYSGSVYLVLGENYHKKLNMEKIAVCDIDEDGERDIVCITDGGTSGVCTTIIEVIKNGECYFNSYTSMLPYVSFAKADGKLVIRTKNDKNETFDYNIVLSEEYQNDVAFIDENGNLHQKDGIILKKVVLYKIGDTPDTTKEKEKAEETTTEKVEYDLISDDKFIEYINRERNGEKLSEAEIDELTKYIDNNYFGISDTNAFILLWTDAENIGKLEYYGYPKMTIQKICDIINESENFDEIIRKIGETDKFLSQVWQKTTGEYGYRYDFRSSEYNCYEYIDVYPADNSIMYHKVINDRNSKEYHYNYAVYLWNKDIEESENHHITTDQIKDNLRLWNNDF